jgi:hypothetical protein
MSLGSEDRIMRLFVVLVAGILTVGCTLQHETTMEWKNMAKACSNLGGKSYYKTVESGRIVSQFWCDLSLPTHWIKKN